MTTPARPPVGIYAALAENGVIGRDGDLPWRLSTDLKRFKSLTLGKPIVMGRRTWESFPKRPLPGRTNIVITRQADFALPGAVRAGSLADALEIAAGEMPDEICVIGGGQIFAEAIAMADILHLTHVQAEMDGDTYFPPVNLEDWAMTDEEDSHATIYAIYARKSTTA